MMDFRYKIFREGFLTKEDYPSKKIMTALMDHEYDTAEKLIRVTEPSTLNAMGIDFKVALTQVLTVKNINLFLAKLLVELGADPNLMFYEILVIGRVESKSPMEMLLNLIEKSRFISEDVMEDKIVGLDNELECNPLKYREQLLQLLDIFLAREGDPNIRAQREQISLYHLALANTFPDMDVILRLTAAGGLMNRDDPHGTTAFMGLVTHARADLSLAILTEIERTQIDVQELCLSMKNEHKESPLWLAGYAGSPGMAMELLKRGAIATPCRQKVICPDEDNPFRNYRSTTRIAALLSPLLRRSFPYKMFSVMDSQVKTIWSVPLLNKVISYSISPLIDNLSSNICFPFDTYDVLKRTIVQNCCDKDSSLPPEISHVPVLMFGQLTTGLQQLCVRIIMEQVCTVSDEYCGSFRPSLSYDGIEDLVVNQLRLPPTLIPQFTIEETKLDLAYYLFKSHARNQCLCGCEDESSDDSDDCSSETSDDDYFDVDLYGSLHYRDESSDESLDC